jgi:hypothetical protein
VSSPPTDRGGIVVLDDGFSIVGVWAFLRAHLVLCVVASFAGVGLGLAVSYAFPRQYEAAALLVPVADQDGAGGVRSLANRYGALASLVGIDVSSGDFSNAAMLATVRSRGFLEEFISAEGLLTVLFADRWDLGSGKWKDLHDVPTVQDAYELFSKKVLAVQDDRKTGLVTVRVTWKDGVVAAIWANAIVRRANAVTRDRAISNAEKAITYLRSEAANADTVELRQSIYSLLESQMNRRMLAVTRPDFAFRVIDIARPPDPRRPISPRRWRFAALGAALGLLAALAIAGFNDAKRSNDRRPQ